MSVLIFALIAFSYNAFPVEVSLEYPSGQSSKRYDLPVSKKLSIDLEFGREINSIVIHEEGDFRVLQQTETSVTVMNEGPHIDLHEWKHGMSGLKQLKTEKNKYFWIDQSKEANFPDSLDLREMVDLVRKKGNDWWADHAKKCKTPNDYPCATVPSKFIFKIQKRKEDRFIDVGVVELMPPMGC